MKPISHGWCRALMVTLLLAAFCSAAAVAQESKSAPLVKELCRLLDQAKLDSIAAKDPSGSDHYVAALYFSGSQLLVVSARYVPAVLLNEKLDKQDYRDIYTDLNSATDRESRVFVMDLGADGLKARREENQPYDTVEQAGKMLVFDGDWKKQKMTEEEYTKAFADADAQYARMLSALLAQLKKTS
jgi:hypothetical protein